MGDDLPQRDDEPRGLLGLIVWPLRFLLLGALGIAAAVVQGILAAFLPNPHDGQGDGQDSDDQSSTNG